MEHSVTILQKRFVTHDVRQFVLTKPPKFVYTPGQAADVSLQERGWTGEKRPFTFTGLNDEKTLEFSIKRYPEHHGVTDRIHRLGPGDKLTLSDPWGTIQYKGPGTFIAGGAGITPFIAILRRLHHNRAIPGHRLFFSNKMKKDIIYEPELQHMFGWNHKKLVLTLTDERHDDYYHDRIDRVFLENHIDDFSQHFYVCGPPAMVTDIRAALESLGASVEAVVFEK